MKWAGNPAKSKDFSIIVFDYYMGGMLELVKNESARLLWLKRCVHVMDKLRVVGVMQNKHRAERGVYFL